MHPKILMQVADAAGGGTGAAGAGASGAGTGGAGAAAGAVGAAAGAVQTDTAQAGAGQQAKTQDGTTTEAGKTADAKATTAPAPFVPRLPQGIKLNDEVFKEFSAIFADEKLSVHERQQKLIDLQVKQVQAAQKKNEEQERAYQDQLTAQPGKDLESLKADKQFGGQNYEQTLADAQRAMRQFFGDELTALLKPFGMQNTPAILKGLARVGRAISEDTIGKTVHGAQDTGDEAEMRAMFPASFDSMKQESGRR